jgi:hypothetical protein
MAFAVGAEKNVANDMGHIFSSSHLSVGRFILNY